MKKLLLGLIGLLAAGCSLNPANLPRENLPRVIQVAQPPAHGPFYTEEQTPANKFFDNFPKKVVGMREIRKYRAPGARKCLVHILDMHFGFDKDLWAIKYLQDPKEKELLMKHVKDTYDGINAVQKDIFAALMDLKKQGVINRARSEGFTERHSLEAVKRFYENMMRNVLLIGCYEEEFASGNHDAYRYIPGACVVSAVTGSLDIHPGIKNSRPPGLTDIQWKFEGREDKALEIIAESDEPSSVLLFGGQHAFGGKQSCGERYDERGRFSEKDNLAGRNWSLIELVPEHYPQFK